MALKGLSRKRNIKEILLDKKLIDEKKFAKAEEEAKAEGQPIQQALVDKELLSKGKVLKALADDWGVSVTVVYRTLETARTKLGARTNCQALAHWLSRGCCGEAGHR